MTFFRNWELGIDNSLGNPTYTLTTLNKEKTLDNRRSVLCSFGISNKDDKHLYIAKFFKMHNESSYKIINIYSIKTLIKSYSNTSY